MAKADRNSKEAGRKIATRMFAEIRRTNWESECSNKEAANGGKPFVKGTHKHFFYTHLLKKF